MTKADRAKLKALAARPDSEIDTSDIPDMTDAVLTEGRFRPGPVGRRTSSPVALKAADVATEAR